MLSGTPDVSFVETEAYRKLLLCLHAPGRGIVIEGPSGVGKTTAFETAIRQLRREHPELGQFRVLSPRVEADLPHIESLPDWHRSGTVVIDDFHRLHARQDVAEGIANYLKHLADTGARDK
jgi:hypothetical protein